ncbi:hypothetical protein ACKE5C_19235 (plasmid) [Aneurinibacillus thermoaerophilus]|uniref:Toxin ETX/toxin MTX2 n=1 Tax=Aneurinibacillus thermoaerophilus TaxID=143495 RepID=A0ABX8YGG5_ANETH|nr:hypothetical protein [Aneurinibacillus thermoaerophilus]QYY44759.1 hypothetical protein K3F53_19140 [Aneurinibacillus thermoaerophilus]
MVNKSIKKRLGVTSILALSLIVSAMPTKANAAEEIAPPEEISSIHNNSTVTPYFINDFRNVKRDVKTYETWSDYKRVSDNLVTGGAGGSISANQSVTFTTTVSGNIAGLGISTSGSISSSVGYTLNVPPNKRVYMGYRVRYSVEEGTNCLVDIVTGKVLSSSKYVVKRPIYGEYALLNY